MSDLKKNLLGIKIGTSPILSIIKKTFIFNLCTPTKLIGAIIAIIIIPAFVLWLSPTYAFTSTTSLTEHLGLVMFFYSFGLMFPIAIGTSAAPLIAEEVSSGTMLTLISKPINRIAIVLGKFIALFIFGMVLSVLSLIILSLLAMLTFPFYDIHIFFGVNFLYSIIITIFFGGLTLGFSGLFKRARNVTIIPIVLVIFSYLILLIIKQFLIMSTMYSTQASLYERFQLYHFDISYHLANLYTALAQALVPTGVSGWGMFFQIFGVTKNAGISSCGSSGSCSITMDTVVANYYFPIFSNLFLLFLSIGLLCAGIIYFKRRDIS